jgi:hypothetical protein
MAAFKSLVCGYEDMGGEKVEGFLSFLTHEIDGMGDRQRETMMACWI